MSEHSVRVPPVLALVPDPATTDVEAVRGLVASSARSAREGYQLLREQTDPVLHGVIGALEEAHLGSLDRLADAAVLYETLETLHGRSPA